MDNLLEMHGPGRVLFRNTTAGMKGFPKRWARFAKLDPGPEPEHWLDQVSTEYAAKGGNFGLQPSYAVVNDSWILWLVKLLLHLERNSGGSL